MAVVPPPKTVRKLVRTSVDVVSDHGVFQVQRLGYEGLPRDMFVFTCPDWCNVVAETPEGEVVFVWQYRPGTDAMSLEVPGGVIDEGEAPEAAAARELREETGYEAERFELLSVVEPNPALQNNRCYTFLARGAKKTAETEFDDVEDLELALVPKRDVPAILDAGEVTHALVVSALETYLRRSR
ncbi:MAG TPA: NUDIX hydrolase [Labilithrix sp.]|jgi:8-oxo-dGTP pyrophosphatase MutT (NUDIX family)